MSPFTIDPDILERAATNKQRVYIRAVREHGGFRAAARALGLSHEDSARASIRALETKVRQSQQLDTPDHAEIRAATKGWAPEYGLNRPLPPGFTAKGFSTLRKLDDGSLQWEKTEVDKELRHQAILAGIRAEVQNVTRLAPLPAPASFNKHLLNLYIFTDYHLGMRAWAEEGGAHWDMATAEDLIIRCFRQMLATAPDAAVGFIAQIGDFMHFDGLRAVTPTSGHLLDAAAQYQEIVRACIRILRTLVDLALQKHERVVILAAEGNHDLGSSAWMRELLAVLYEDDPRVEIVNNGMPYYAYRWGVNMLAFHHGHGTKITNWPLKFASFFSEMWGLTKKRYAHGGHYHHEIEAKELDGMKTLQHPTLAPNDRHSALGAYHSERQTNVFTYDDRFGEMMKLIFTPQMLEAA